ncbi:spermidine synthase [Spartinivicinus ruber]|uniref:spermidine synthase n=1 Tax=Spartinivicinus ruber TaxID=2683272 RepID=UPI0013D1ED95|nr:spermine synthase [Spartinivicinus ruber]
MLQKIKKLITDFTGATSVIELYRNEDEYGRVIVLEHAGSRILTFDSVYEQSCVLIAKPYSLVYEYLQAMLIGLTFVTPKHVTLLGLGGGSLASCLHHFLPMVEIQVIELRQMVIDVAFKYFLLPSDTRLTVTHADAQKYLPQAKKGSTNIIFADIYQALGMHIYQKRKKFVEDSFALLSDNGWLIINYHQEPNFNESFFHDLCAQYPEVYLCLAGSTENRIILCGKSKLKLDLKLYEAKAKALEREMDIPIARYFKRLIKLQLQP